MTRAEANEKLKDIRPVHHQRICAEFDPKIVIEGLYTLDELKKIVEVFETYLVS